MRTISFFLLASYLCSGGLAWSDADQFLPLLRDLHSTDMATRLKAITSLGESGDVRAIAPLLGTAYNEHGVVRRYAIEALQTLVRLLDDVHVGVKRWLESLIEVLRREPEAERTTVMARAAMRHLGAASRMMSTMVAGERRCASLC